MWPLPQPNLGYIPLDWAGMSTDCHLYYVKSSARLGSVLYSLHTTEIWIENSINSWGVDFFNGEWQLARLRLRLRLWGIQPTPTDFDSSSDSDSAALYLSYTSQSYIAIKKMLTTTELVAWLLVMLTKKQSGKLYFRKFLFFALLTCVPLPGSGPGDQHGRIGRPGGDASDVSDEADPWAVHHLRRSDHSNRGSRQASQHTHHCHCHNTPRHWHPYNASFWECQHIGHIGHRPDPTAYRKSIESCTRESTQIYAHSRQ